MSPPIATTPEIDALIAANSPVAIGVSGGKDSQAAALATFKHLDRVGHTGPRVLIHSDLGRVEWNDSLPVCERLAAHLDCELIVVRRSAGDLLDRWESRWESSQRRYQELETVTVVLPWSTPSMRFCTSELKTHLIASELGSRFNGAMVINVTGVRREESPTRRKGSIASPGAKGKTHDWRPICDWTEAEVFECIATSGLTPHEAYARFRLKRVSCRYCIFQTEADAVAAAAVEESHECYQAMVGLEARSTFAFYVSRWLGDVAPHLLTREQRDAVLVAKEKAAARVALEKNITKGMLFVTDKTRMLTDEEAAKLADVRRKISSLMGFQSQYLDVPSIHARYAKRIEADRIRKTAREAREKRQIARRAAA